MNQEFSSPAFWVQFTLAVIGIGALEAARRTLRQIEEQTRATKIAADAAKVSADTAIIEIKLSHYAYLSMQNWTIAVDVESGISTRARIACDIRNTGNIAAIIHEIEIRNGSVVTTVGASATVYPGESYPFSTTIAWAELREFQDKVVGSVVGTIRYEHHFGRRSRRFSQLFWISNDIRFLHGLEPQEGATNNDEPDSR